MCIGHGYIRILDIPLFNIFILTKIYKVCWLNKDMIAINENWVKNMCI